MMEKPNRLKLPVGFRFRPTDEELLVHYLKRKALSLPLPASVIPVADVFRTNPWDLPGDSGERRYFFSKRKKMMSKCQGIAGSGYWKAIGKEKYVMGLGSNRVVGMKRRMVFHEVKCRHGLRTRWVMHQLRLVGSETSPNPAQKMEMDEEWVVCCIYQRKEKKKKKSKSNMGQEPEVFRSSKTRINIKIRPCAVDEMMIELDMSNWDDHPLQSPSCWSDITEVSDEDETGGRFLP